MESIAATTHPESQLGHMRPGYYMRLIFFMRRWLTTCTALVIFPYFMPHPALALIGCVLAWVWDFREVPKAADFSIRYTDIMDRFRNESAALSEDEAFYNPPKYFLWKSALRLFARFSVILFLIHCATFFGLKVQWGIALSAIAAICGVGWVSRYAPNHILLTAYKRFHIKPLSAKLPFPIMPAGEDLPFVMILNLILWPLSSTWRKVFLRYLALIVGTCVACALLAFYLIFFSYIQPVTIGYALLNLVFGIFFTACFFSGIAFYIEHSIALRHSYVAEYLLTQESPAS